MANFGSCVDWVLRLEDRMLSGVVKDLGDGGGLTRFGIAQTKNPTVDASFYTTDVATALETAKNVYWQKYWTPINGLLLPTDELAATILSFAVNDGVHRAVELLQGVLGVTQDGDLGQMTRFAISQQDPAEIASKLRERQSQFYRDLAAKDPSKAKDLVGWLRRAAAIYPQIPT